MSGWDELYRENILEHYQHPRNKGTLEDADITYEDANPLCGDRIRMDFKIRDGRIDQVRFSGTGCSISQAAASMMAERIEGKTLEEVKDDRQPQTRHICCASGNSRHRRSEG